MVTKTCMLNWLAYKGVPEVYRNTIADAAVKATSASALKTALKAKGMARADILSVRAAGN